MAYDQLNKKFEYKIVNIYLSISFNICLCAEKNRFFEHLKHMFKPIEKIFTILHLKICLKYLGICNTCT